MVIGRILCRLNLNNLCLFILLRGRLRRNAWAYLLLDILTLGIDFAILILHRGNHLTLPPLLSDSFDFLHSFELDELLKNVLPFCLKLDSLENPWLVVGQVIDVRQKLPQIELLVHAFSHPHQPLLVLLKAVVFPQAVGDFLVELGICHEEIQLEPLAEAAQVFAVKEPPSTVSELLQDQEVGVELLVAVNHETTENHEEVGYSGHEGDEIEDRLDLPLLSLSNHGSCH